MEELEKSVSMTKEEMDKWVKDSRGPSHWREAKLWKKLDQVMKHNDTLRERVDQLDDYSVGYDDGYNAGLQSCQ